MVLWIPAKASGRISVSGIDNETELAIEVSSFSRNTVTDEDLDLDFPPGTEVVDLVARIAYRVLPGGGTEMLRLVDAATGELIARRMTWTEVRGAVF